MEVPPIQIHPDSLKELVVGNKKFRSYMDFRLNDSDLEICRKELNEVEADRNASIKKLREMLCNDGDIKYRTDDAYLLRYLRYKKFNIKEAYRKIRKFYTIRMEIPDLFYLPTNMDKLLKASFFNVMPYTTEQGNLVFTIKLGKWNLNEVSLHDTMLMYNLISDLFCSNPHSVITGCVDIFDVTDTTIEQTTHLLHPRNIKIWSMIVQELYPWRIKSILFYNCNTLQYAAIASVRYFLKKKVADRIVLMRSDLSELHKHVPPEILPKEYGGMLEENEYNGHINRYLLDNLRYLQYENSFIGVKKS